MVNRGTMGVNSLPKTVTRQRRILCVRIKAAVLLPPALRQVHAAILAAWRGAVLSGVRRMNDVNARLARLVLGWVIVCGRVYHLCPLSF